MIIAIGSAAGLACGSDSGIGQTADWTVRDSAGVTLVSNHSDAISNGCVTVAQDPEITIPSGAASPPLYRVRGGVVLDDGRIAVLNAGSSELRFYGPNGWYQHAVGGKGRGPGEFLDPRWLGQGDNDTLFVWDSRLNRLSMFDGEGDLLGSHQVRATAWRDVPGVFGGRFADGSFYVSPAALAFFDGTPGIVRLPEAHGRYDLETRQAEVLFEGRGNETVSSKERIYILPFGKEEMAVAHGDALVIGDNGTSTLRYYDLRGQLRRVVDWVFDPIPITARDQRAWRQHFDETVPAHVRRPDETTRFADDRPRFSSIQSDLIGWLWVRWYYGGWEPQGHWLVFDEDGVLRCSVDPPPVRRFRPLQIRETHILGVQRNEVGEETVVLYSLARDIRR